MLGGSCDEKGQNEISTSAAAFWSFRSSGEGGVMVIGNPTVNVVFGLPSVCKRSLRAPSSNSCVFRISEESCSDSLYAASEDCPTVGGASVGTGGVGATGVIEPTVVVVPGAVAVGFSAVGENAGTPGGSVKVDVAGVDGPDPEMATLDCRRSMP